MAGDTTLARQLKKLAVPQTTVLIQDKIRKSFLFDHRDASGLDREVVFAFGTCGLQKLCTINPLFSKFENDLFSLSYKDFQRSVQSSAVNEKLDAKISEFLRMLSPYFLIRDAHEALEWLIYRFHIHLYNVDDLIASVLPHHNTATFVRVVQLLDLNENNRWFWLKPIQTNGVHLEYSAILNRFLTDGGFRKFLCDITPNVLAVYTHHKNIAVPIVSFSMCTIYNAFEKCKNIENKLINPLLPYILDGLKSDFMKYTSASYMIISKMLSLVQLSSKVIEGLLVTIFQTLKSDLMLEACEILSLAFQSQPIKCLPSKVFTHFLSDTDSANILFGLLDDVKTFSLIKAFIKKSFSMLSSSKMGNCCEVLKFVKQLLKRVTFNKKCVLMCFNITKSKIIKCSKDKNVKKSFNHIKKIVVYIFQLLERRYPDHFDKAYRKFFEQKPNKTVCSIINQSVCSIKYEVVPDRKTSLVLGLYHVNGQIRHASVSYLLHTVATRESYDREFVANSLNDRLYDDDPNVVLQILSNLDIVLQVLDKFKMLSAFEKILSAPIRLKSEWYPVQMKCLRIIIRLYQDDENEFDVMKLLLNFIFPVNNHTLAGFLQLVKSDFKHPFIDKIKFNYENLKHSRNITDEMFSQINCTVVSCLKQFVGELNGKLKMMFVSTLNLQISSMKSDSILVFYIYAMLFILETTKNTSSYLLFLNDFLLVLNSYISMSNIVAEKFEIVAEECVIKKCVESLNSNHFPSHLILYSLYRLIIGHNLVIPCTSWPDVSGSYSDSHKILSNIFNFCILHLHSSKDLLSKYFQKMLSVLISSQFNSVQESLWFLSTKLLDSSESSIVQFNAINIAIALCKGQNQIICFFENPMIFFSVVKTIANPIPKLSHSALLLLSLSSESITKEIHPFKSLGDEIIKKSEEIKTDYRQCFNCVGNWLKTAVDYKDTKKSSRIGKELQYKISVLEEILSLLTKEVVPYSVKHFLLCCLQNNDCPTILSSYIPILFNYLSVLGKSHSEKEDILNIISLLIKKFTPKTVACFTEDSTESKALLYCLNFTIKKDDELDRSVQAFTLDVLSIDLFSAIASDKMKLQIIENLLVLYMTYPLSVNTKVVKVLRKLCPYAYLFIKHHEEKMNTSKSTTLREAKRFKHAESDTSDVLESNLWEKITVLLELMQNESNFLEKEKVISGLFVLLEKSINYDKEPSVEYIKQLILSAIYNCYEQLIQNSQQKVNYDDFHIDKVILCIRTSSNPKTHHQALMLLNLAATIFPDHILNKIMSVFVFMGSDLVRQDDSYSFQVLLQIIETIMPSFLKVSNQQAKTDGYQIVSPVIRNFVNSLLHIPEHRRLPLFTRIVTTLDPSEYLWIPLCQICDKYGDAFPDIPNDDSKSWKMSGDNENWNALDFAVSLHQEFSSDIQIDTCINLLKFLLMLPDTKKQLESNPTVIKDIKELFDLEVHTEHVDKQLQMYKQNILYYIKLWFSSDIFLNQIEELSVKQQSNLEDRYKLLLKLVLEFLQSRQKIVKSSKQDTIINNQVQLLYDLIHGVNSFLPSNLFLQVMIQLLENDDEEIQLKAIELLNSKLEQEGDFLFAKDHCLLLKLMEPLTTLVDAHLNKDDKNENSVVILQAAIYSLHLLCKLISKEDLKNFSKKVQRRCKKDFFKVLEISVAILTHYEKPELTVNALLCVAQLCHCLNVDILRNLNSFMPIIINILQDNKLLNMNECLVLGILVALNSIVENLGSFLSSYMEDIIVNTCLCSVKYAELGKRNIAENFVNLQTKLANEIPVRIFTNIILSSYSKLSRKDVKSVIPLMKILTQNLESSKYEDILASAAELQNIYISLIDFRNSHQTIPAETINPVESSIVSSLQTFVMKLSVTRFRTFFQKVYQWTVASNDEEAQKFRIFTFYKITSEFSKSLKSLFSVMSKYFFTHISSILDLCNFSKSKTHYFDSDPKLSHELLVNMLDTLNYCFMYSEEQLLDKENFELIMQPLVDHLENIHDEIMYQELIDCHLKSCIAQFMVAVSDNSLWKSLNYQILLKTRHNSAKVRFGALQVILEVVNKMGDNYLILLPESIPFLAEIMEDESSEVEQECQTVIMEMEKTLGEPIRNYF